MPTNKMARMSPEAEGRIAAAVEEAVDLIGGGEHPDDAITKVAAERQLPPGHVRLLAHAYNTGRTNRQRQDHDRLAEKAADFPLADPAAILDRLYPAEVKTAAALARAEGVSRDYDEGPGWLERARGRALGEKRAAAATPIAPAAPAAYPKDPTTAARREFVAAEKAAKARDAARREFAAAQDAVAAEFGKLASWFAGTGRPAIADVRPNVEALWGKAGAAVLDHVGRTRPALAKRAAAAGPPGAVDRRAEPYRTVAAAVGLAEKAAAARDAYAALLAVQAPPPPAVPASPLGLPRKAAAIKDVVGVEATRGLLGRLGAGLRGPDKDKLVLKQLGGISTPDHEQELRGIQTQAMLHEMLSGDPVISSYKPDEVADAFNQVSQLAPHAATQPAVVGPLLRKWLQQGNLDTFETDNVVGTEQKLKDIHGGARKGLLPNGPAPGSLLA